MAELEFVSYKNRQLEKGDKVHVYRNLHAESLSIKKKTLVHGHAMLVRVSKASFKVSKSGNERTRAKNQKNVHAFVSGILEASEMIVDDVQIEYQKLEQDGYTRVYYNPYKVETFVHYITQEPVFNAREAVVIMDRVYIK